MPTNMQQSLLQAFQDLDTYLQNYLTQILDVKLTHFIGHTAQCVYFIMLSISYLRFPPVSVIIT